MKQERKETLTTRVISTTFVILTLAIFKPFGLDGQWQTYTHLLALWCVGVCVCMLTDIILKYIVKMPRSLKRGVSYIIRRNLWFQLINTVLVTIAICLYRHFVMSSHIEGNRLSMGNFFETLLIMGFCSFTIGLYWRFKYRSRYLAAELEETRQLNEQLSRVEREETVVERGDITLTGNTNESVTLQVANLLYIETVGNYVKVYHLCDGVVKNDLLRATSKQMEDELQACPMIVRCHRAFLVNLCQVEQIIAKTGSMQLLIKHSHEYIPVSRSNMAQIKEAIKSVQ